MAADTTCDNLAFTWSITYHKLTHLSQYILEIYSTHKMIPMFTPKNHIVGVIYPTNIPIVGGFNPSEKYESQLGRIIPYMKWKIRVMFQTTNQIVYLYYLLLITIMVIYHTNIPHIYYNLRIVHTLNPVTLALGPLEISQ